MTRAAKRVRPTTKAERESDRVRHLLALDAATLMRRLEKRQGEMVEIFGRRRDRAALVDPLRTTFHGAGFRELVHLTIVEQRCVTRFYEAVDELRWYFQYTEDMPGTLGSLFEGHRRAIAEAYARLRAEFAVDVVLEPEDAADVVAQAVREAEGRAKKR